MKTSLFFLLIASMLLGCVADLEPNANAYPNRTDRIVGKWEEDSCYLNGEQDCCWDLKDTYEFTENGEYLGWMWGWLGWKDYTRGKWEWKSFSENEIIIYQEEIWRIYNVNINDSTHFYEKDTFSIGVVTFFDPSDWIMLSIEGEFNDQLYIKETYFKPILD